MTKLNVSIKNMSTVVNDSTNQRYQALDFVSTSSPHDEYELIQRIGSGTYGDVYKVCIDFEIQEKQFKSRSFFSPFRQDIFLQHRYVL